MKQAILVILVPFAFAAITWAICPLIGGFVVWDLSPERWSMPAWPMEARLCFIVAVLLSAFVAFMYRDDIAPNS